MKYGWRWQRKPIAYCMILLMLLNLCTVPGSGRVYADNDTFVTISGMTDGEVYSFPDAVTECAIGYTYASEKEPGGYRVYLDDAVIEEKDGTQAGATGTVTIHKPEDAHNHIIRVEFLATQEIDQIRQAYTQSLSFKIRQEEPEVQLTASTPDGVIADGANVNQSVTLTYRADKDNEYTKAYRQVTKDGTLLQDKSGEIALQETQSGTYVQSFAETIDAQTQVYSEYSVSFWLENADGQVFSKQTIAFAMDCKEPELETKLVSASDADGDYYTLEAEASDDTFWRMVVTGSRQVMDADGTIRTEGLPEQELTDAGLIAGQLPKLVIDYKEDGIYTLQVDVYDHAGNHTKKQDITFSVDRTAPVISIKDKTAVGQDGFYQRIQLEAEVRDLNPSPDDYIVKIKRPGQSAETVSAVWNRKDATRYDLVMSFGTGSEETAEGQYTVEIAAKDTFGNAAAGKNRSFIIDTTAPVVDRIAVDVEGSGITTDKAEDGRYYRNGKSRFAISVQEAYPGTMSTADAVITKDGQAYDSRHFSLDQTSGTYYTDYYEEEGDYQVKVSGKDQAGNQGVQAQETLVIDRTAPEFGIMAIRNGVLQEVTGNPAFRDDQRLQFYVSDKHHKTESYTIQIKRQTQDGVVRMVQIQGASIQWTTGSQDQLIYERAFSEEGQYTVIISGKDQAGNEGQSREIRFRIDRTPPQITQLSSVAQGAYYNTALKLRYQVEEFHYGDARAYIRVERMLDAVTHTQTREDSVYGQELSLTGQNTEFEYDCIQEGAYRITIYVRDAAGNDNTQELAFVIDRSLPQLGISGADTDGMYADGVELQYRATDRNHDFSRYQVYVERGNARSVEATYTQQFTGDWPQTGYDRTRQQMYESVQKVSYTQEGYYKIRFRGQDLAGNTAVEQTRSFYIDRTAPVISDIRFFNVNGMIEARYQNIYSNVAVRMEFVVDDAVTGVNPQSVYVTVGQPEDRTGDSKRYFAHKMTGNRYYVVIPSDVIVSELNCPLTVWASDRKGNEGHAVSTNIVYNKAYPGIEMSCKTDYRKWTNQNVTFQTKVTDLKSGLKEVTYAIDGKQVKRVTFNRLTTTYAYDLTATESADTVAGYLMTITVTNNAGTTSTASRRVYIDKNRPRIQLSGVTNGMHYRNDPVVKTEVTDTSYKNTKTVYYIERTLDGKTERMSAPVFSSSAYTDSCMRRIMLEGEYRIYAVATDSAGNRTKSNTLTFVLDKTAPELSISGTGEGSMNAGPVTIQFGCVESFFATNAVDIRVDRTLDGVTTTSSIGEFPKHAKTTSVQHTFSEDGTYRITFSATDKAGNVAQSRTISFSVDQTKPEIQITGSGNYEQWDRPATIRFAVNESYYEGDHVEITGTRTDIDGNVTELALEGWNNAGKQSGMERTFKEDGIYTFEVQARDEAGNRDSKEIHFTIDQTAPQIHRVKQFDGGYYQAFQLADSLDEVFKDLTVVSCRILLNGVEYDGVEPVTEEGKYNLYVEATDELGHKQSENAEFIIDHTAPKVIFTGVKDGETVKDSGIVTISLVNAEDEITDVTMNGVSYGADVRELEYKEYGSYNIEVACKDRAGNQAVRTVYFVYHNPVTIAVLFGVMGLLVVGTCLGLWLRTRKKEKEERKL